MEKLALPRLSAAPCYRRGNHAELVPRANLDSSLPPGLLEQPSSLPFPDS
jgi:hypothetical protein